MTKTKILIASTLVPPQTGGAEKIAWEHARLLSQNPNYDVHLLTCTHRPKYIKNVHFHILPRTLLPTIYFATIGRLQIRKMLRKHSFDIIHCHMSLPWGYVFKNAHAKKIITFHGCEYLNKDIFFRHFAKEACKNASALISPSKWLSFYVQKQFGYQSMVIPNGIETSKYRISSANSVDESRILAQNGKPEKKIVLFVGRLIEMKGIWELLRAAKDLPQYEFWLVGRGKLKKNISLPNTKKFGYLTQEKLAQLYKKATICVFPSHHENFPTVALEALSAGKAIVATTGGFSEIIEDYKEGLLVPAKNSFALKKAIVELMEHPEQRIQFEQNALRKARQFDLGVMVNRYTSVYTNI